MFQVIRILFLALITGIVLLFPKTLLVFLPLIPVLFDMAGHNDWQSKQKPKTRKHFVFLRRMLAGSPLPPLPRRMFLRQTCLIVLRGFILFVLFHVAAYFAEFDPQWTEGWEKTHLFFALLIGCMFFVPYLRVMHRRMVGIGCRFPATLSGLVFSIIMAVIFHLPDDATTWEWDLYGDLLLLAPYLVLLAWPDADSVHISA